MKVPPFQYKKDEQHTRCGLLAWLFPVAVGDTPAFSLVAAMFDSGSAADALQCEALLGPERYRRVQIPLEKSVPLDGHQKVHVDYLDDVTSRYFDSQQWAKDRQWVMENYLK
jgi:hypothetical protein